MMLRIYSFFGFLAILGFGYFALVAGADNQAALRLLGTAHPCVAVSSYCPEASSKYWYVTGGVQPSTLYLVTLWLALGLTAFYKAIRFLGKTVSTPG